MKRHGTIRVPRSQLLALVPATIALLAALVPNAVQAQTCERVMTADVVALDQVYWLNRLGAVQADGMIYALARDVVPDSFNENVCPQSKVPASSMTPGSVRLRRSVRPRPLVLRVNEGDCLDIRFTNLLKPYSGTTDPMFQGDRPRERDASIHVQGMQYRVSITDGGMHVGTGASGIVGPGGATTYRVFAEKEGTYLMYSGGALVGGESYGGSLNPGLFGAINVQPRGSRFFRSQVTRNDLDLAKKPPGTPGWDTRFPEINYTAKYPAGSPDPEVCWQSDDPILEMTKGNEIVQPDLTAIVTGPDLDGWTPGRNGDVRNIYWDRNQPYREFTIIFHDEMGAVQAFPQFNDELLQHTLHSVRDSFAINYGSGGAGAEVIANRLGVGPMHQCIDCRYEEFFLTAWAVGDPAMVVDVPANAPVTRDQVKDAKNVYPLKGPKANVAYYPDDPSNVYHSYLNDRVKFRNLLAGTDDHHIFHLHAHQWLQTPNEETSTYMDSQAIGQGSSFTYEIAYNGSGNRNLTAGDSIFHCHYYPHFAQGMWSMWRVHDTLEIGTKLDSLGRPESRKDKVTGEILTTTRALPDGEIQYGTPIPAIVPIPNKPMVPPPTSVQLRDGQIDTNYVETQATNAKNSASPFYSPGYPFYVPGIAGQRPPQPPMDFAVDNGVTLDGGLPRFVGLSGTATSHANRLDMTKHVDTMVAKWVPEAGTLLEQYAMQTHAVAGFDTPAANSRTAPTVPKNVEFNGMPPVSGAPFADPCRKDAYSSVVWQPGGGPRRYKGADIELDIRLNKEGWHFPQSRIGVLAADVYSTLNGSRNPEPLFLRANSGECVEYQFTNLVPEIYQTDDFQVKTNTDVIAQHIHLVKFDVMTSDGGANGFNYQDGSLSPEAVQAAIHAIRTANKCDEQGIGDQPFLPGSDRLYCPEPRVHPWFPTSGDVNCDGKQDFLGAQTTVQRWWADPVLNNAGQDRTLQTVFTHDHYGPSTHQQVGLYMGLIVEPAGSQFFHNESGTQLSTGRWDGGPTSWQARIEPPGGDSVREFALEYGDFQLAYEQPREGCYRRECPDARLGLANPALAINPPGRVDNKNIVDLYNKPVTCPAVKDPDGTMTTENTDNALPCPEAVSAHDPGFISVNYRTEPLALRLADSNGLSPNQSTGTKGDPSYGYETRTDRNIATMNDVPYGALRCVNYDPLTSPTDLFPGDPFTPVMRVYEGDDVKIRILVGAHEEEHNLTVNGLKWLRQEFYDESGWRDSQMMGISEHFELAVGPMPTLTGDKRDLDLLYRPSAAAEWQWDGAWGLIRTHAGLRSDLGSLNDNPTGRIPEEKKRDQFGTVPVDEARPASNEKGSLADELQQQAARQSATGPADTLSNRFGSGSYGSRPTIPVSCPPNASIRTYDVTAVAAREVLSSFGGPVGQSLVYNRRTGAGPDPGPLHDPTAIMFVRTDDLNYPIGVPNPRPTLKPNAPVEPLILRAAAGECIEVVLRNDLPPSPTADPNTGWAGFGFDLLGWSGWTMIIEHFNANHIKPSQEVGLHPQLVAYDPAYSDGMNVGRNPSVYGNRQTVRPGEKIKYYWFAGHQGLDQFGNSVSYPIEFGATGLTSSDSLKHTNKGAVGALIIEPVNALLEPAFNDNQSYETDTEARFTRAETTINLADGSSFREFVTIFQNDLNLRYGKERTADGTDAVENLTVYGDPTESGQKGFNYRTEPTWFRLGISPKNPGNVTDQDRVLTDGQVGNRRPVTPIFTAKRNAPFRFRVVHPGGHTQASVFELQGHLWQEYPYEPNTTNRSDTIGNNPTSSWEGSRYGMGPSDHDDIIPIHGAGGAYGVTGEYLYRDYVPWYFAGGLWGVFEVKTDTSVPPKNTASPSPSLAN